MVYFFAHLAIADFKLQCSLKEFIQLQATPFQGRISHSALSFRCSMYTGQIHTTSMVLGTGNDVIYMF